MTLTLWEVPLSFIFGLTSRWKVLVLLDEADAFVEQLSFNHTTNSQILGFLRKLE
jgi:hypothetical protein